MNHDHISYLQSNLNHSAAAQDLFLQTVAEWGIGVAVAAEPYVVLRQPHWAGDSDGSVAIFSGTGSPLFIKDRGPGFVATVWEGCAIVGVYFSPNRPLRDLESLLNTMGPVVRRLAPLPILVMGDFNAKSRAWGAAATDLRGSTVEEWAAELGLSLLNRGTVHTCVRQNGGFVVDLSFATPSVARRVHGWRVLRTVEVTTSPHSQRVAFPRWSLARLNRELAEEAAIVQSWRAPAPISEGVDESAARLRTALTRVCDVVLS